MCFFACFFLGEHSPQKKKGREVGTEERRGRGKEPPRGRDLSLGQEEPYPEVPFVSSDFWARRSLLAWRYPFFFFSRLLGENKPTYRYPPNSKQSSNNTKTTKHTEHFQFTEDNLKKTRNNRIQRQKTKTTLERHKSTENKKKLRNKKEQPTTIGNNLNHLKQSHTNLNQF